MEISKGCAHIPFKISAKVTYLLFQHNILINNETPPRACITDFGLSAVVPSKTFGPTKPNGGGTFGYMAPELISEGAEPSREADMYAFGMVVYEVVTGTRPFGHRNHVELPVLTLQGSRPYRPEDLVDAGFGHGTWEFAERCWDENPTLRPSAREVLVHFERVARTSRDVDPGPTIPVHEPVRPRPENSSHNLCECRIHRKKYPS
jgi:serine/threonine protein kinase